MNKKRSQHRPRAACVQPFKIGAPSMVFGENLMENAHLLAGIVDHIEIILFYTPTLNNFPSVSEIKALKRLGADEDLSFSVHLPAFLEIASPNLKNRDNSVQRVIDLINFMDELNPLYNILHIPFTPPTLTSVPGRYLTIKHRDKFIDWTKRATESLETIQSRIKQNNRILVENINYSPIFLENFWKLGLCGFCLDMGHLILGRESVSEVTKQFISVIEEIHLHGVTGYEEHLSLTVLPKIRVFRWMNILVDAEYRGVVNLEVFSAECLETSISMLIEFFQTELSDCG